MGDAAFLDLIASTLFLKAAFEKSIEAIKSKIRGHQIIIEQLERRLSDAEELEDKEDAEMEQVAVRPLMEDVKKAIETFNKVLIKFNRNFKEHK